MNIEVIIRTAENNPHATLTAAMVKRAMVDAAGRGSRAEQARAWLLLRGEDWLMMACPSMDVSEPFQTWLIEQPWYERIRVVK